MKLYFLLLSYVSYQYTKDGVVALKKNQNYRLRRQNEDIQPRIIGGTPVDKGSYPSYAIPISGYGLCGATLIHDDILLSAGHCSGAFEGNDIAIGATLLNGDDATEIIRAETELTNPDFSMSTLENDSLLIKLEKPATVPLVQWNEDYSYPVDGDNVRVIGFGLTEAYGDTSNDLLEVTLEIVDYDTCNEVYGNVGSGPIV